jgi:hypothetical protein
MRGLLIEDNKVVNVAIFDELLTGWVEDTSGVGIGWTDNRDGSFSAPEATPLTSQEIRDLALISIEYDFGDGRVMQTRPQDESNIRNAIEVMEANSIGSIEWVMKNNVKHPVTSAELKAALTAAQSEAMQIWAAYYPGV